MISMLQLVLLLSSSSLPDNRLASLLSLHDVKEVEEVKDEEEDDVVVVADDDGNGCAAASLLLLATLALLGFTSPRHIVSIDLSLVLVSLLILLVACLCVLPRRMFLCW